MYKCRICNSVTHNVSMQCSVLKLGEKNQNKMLEKRQSSVTFSINLKKKIHELDIL